MLNALQLIFTNTICKKNSRKVLVLSKKIPKKTQLAEFLLEKVQFCNHDKLYNSTWKRNLVSSDFQFSEDVKSNHRCFEFSVGDLNFVLDQNNIALKVFFAFLNAFIFSFLAF